MLRIVGDCNFADGFFDLGFGVGAAIKNGANPFQNIKDNGHHDYWIGNFECVCSDVSDQNGAKSKQFIIAPADCAGIDHLDFYGIANNHVMQHGAEAYLRLAAYLDKEGVEYAGTREKRTAVILHQGKNVAISVFNQRPENFSDNPLYWSMPDYREVSDELNKYQYCDARIVIVHWGIEFINYPYVDQRQFAHFLVDCGADLVAGMHPHVMQGYEIYKGKNIFYSLGNCVFNMPWEPTKYSLMVNYDLATNQVSFQYLHLGKYGFPSITTKVPDVLSMEHLNTLLHICEDNEKYFQKAADCLSQYRKANHIEIIKNVWRYKLSDISSILTDYLKNRLG